MKRRLRSVLISHKMTPLYGMNLCGYGADAEGVQGEIPAAEDMLQAPQYAVHLIAMDISDTQMTEKIADLLKVFLEARTGGPDDPVHKMAVLGAPGWKRFWWRIRWKMTWPSSAHFFDTQEDAKAWLIREG